MTEHTQNTVFSTVEQGHLPEARSVSRLAVLALVFGLTSAFALYSAVAWILPAVSTVLGIAALRTIAGEPGRYVGRWAAIAGLACGLLFGGWGISNSIVTQQLVFQQARGYAQLWLELVSDGRLEEAYQLHLEQSRRRAPGTELSEFYADDVEVKREFEGFFRGAPLQEIVSLGDSAVWRFVGDQRLSITRNYGEVTELVTQRFAVDFEQDGKPQTCELMIVLARKRHRESKEARWQVTEVRPVEDEKS